MIGQILGHINDLYGWVHMIAGFCLGVLSTTALLCFLARYDKRPKPFELFVTVMLAMIFASVWMVNEGRPR